MALKELNHSQRIVHIRKKKLITLKGWSHIASNKVIAIHILILQFVNIFTGVNIWSKRCNNEFEWQKQTGVYAWLQSMDIRIQELGGYGVFRFLDNLFNAFQALFEHGTKDSSFLAQSYEILERTRQISAVSFVLILIYSIVSQNDLKK